MFQVTRLNRFWSRVLKTDKHWLWIGYTENGYGIVRWDEGRDKAHRVAYAMSYGRIPDGFKLENKCGFKNCVNPEHWQIVESSNFGAYANLHRTKKLNDNKIFQIRELYREGITVTDIRKKFGFSKETIYKIIAPLTFE